MRLVTRLKAHLIWIAVLGLIAIFTYLIFYRLGSHPFIDWDESIYVQVAKESLEHGRHFAFTYFDRLWFEKPPVVIWLTELSFALFGYTEWAARLFVGVAAVATFLVTGLFTYRLSQDKVAAWLAMTCYFIALPFITSAYFLNFDTFVGLFILLSLYCFWQAQTKTKYFYGFGIFLAIGVLTKNIIGLFPLAIIPLYSLMTWDFAYLKIKQFYYGLLLFLVLIIPWHLYQSVTFGQAFWHNYLWYHVWHRYTEAIESNGAPADYFIDIIFRYPLFKWLSLGGFGYGLWRAFKREKSLQLLLAAIIVILVVLSLAQTKLDAYITIIFPYLTALIGVALARLLRLTPFVWLRVLAVLVITLSFIGLGWQFNNYKLAKGEATLEYLDNKAVGLYLKDRYRELPVYTNFDNYRGLALGYYAQRSIMPLPHYLPAPSPEQLTAERLLYRRATENVFHMDNYIYIVR
jgi:4-amino-4-deoxy-L-arabinose transferase-like glycosyltransferase